MATQDPPDRALAAVVRRLRTDQGATQEDMAYASGLTISSYREIELGRANPAWTTVRRLADALEVGMAELVEAVEAVEATETD